MFSAGFSGFCYRASGNRFHGFVTERLVTDSMVLVQNVW